MQHLNTFKIRDGQIELLFKEQERRLLAKPCDHISPQLLRKKLNFLGQRPTRLVNWCGGDGKKRDELNPI